MRIRYKESFNFKERLNRQLIYIAKNSPVNAKKVSKRTQATPLDEKGD